jgi:hypothetical protein
MHSLFIIINLTEQRNITIDITIIVYLVDMEDYNYLSKMRYIQQKLGQSAAKIIILPEARR